MKYFPYDTKSILNKVIGAIYFFLGGMLVFLSFYLPNSFLQDAALKYVVPIFLMLVSILLIINGYIKFTEGGDSSSISSLDW